MVFMKKIISLVCFLIIISCQSINDQNDLPNLILINVDDLGWTDLSVMGSKYYQTPNIDKLSDSGMTFFNAYASANCAPSRATMLTGKYPTEHQIYTVGNSERGNKKTRKLIPVKNKTVLDLNFLLIPEMLKIKGYVNGHFGKWHLGSEGFYPEDNGFDINIGGSHMGSPGKEGYFSPYSNPSMDDGPEGEYLTDRIGDEVVRFIDNNKENTFFAYVPFFSVHTPIQSKKEYQEKYLKIKGDNNHNRSDYAGMIESVDENIGKILNKIESLNLLNETLVIFTSDNGGIRAISNQFPLRAGKGSYYEGGIKVPLIFSWKGKIKPNSKSYERVSNIDLFPTIKNIVGYNNNYLKLEGLDLSPVFENKKLNNRSLFFHFPIYLEAYNVHMDNGTDPLFRTRPGSVIIKDDWKLHHYFENNSLELYNLKEDVSESNNVFKENEDKTNELYQELDSWRKKNNAPIPNELNSDFDQKFVDSLLLQIQENKVSGRIFKIK